MRISVVVIAQDEADRLRACLDSVGFADELVVLDGGSRDGTVRVARSAGARVAEWPFEGFVAQRNRAMALCAGDWVLCLDADERLMGDPGGALREAALRDGVDGFRLRFATVLDGVALAHGRWGRERHLRFVRRAAARWIGPEPHERLEVDGGTAELDVLVHHHTARGLLEQHRKMGRYADAARQGHDGHRGPAIAAGHGLLHLGAALIARQGWRDGWRGFAAASLAASASARKWR